MPLSYEPPKQMLSLHYSASMETGSRSTAADTNTRCGSYRPPSVDSNDDELEDSDSLYQEPTLPSPKPRPARSKPVQLDLTTRPKEGSYILDTKIAHESLDLGSRFPGSHDFYRTHDRPDQEVFMLKPKVRAEKSHHKRMHSGAKIAIVQRRRGPAR
ncbi:hypothetical protein G6011_07095 [Alternaria panax]|uniref:Uncharacterized protein n=1 Tax=Alternaria panax TaxID=48097 RepID=A0AAD4FDY6_9PLEO|nr:hypothetical protein G6011_07095 [Alternaria panax]